MRCSFWILNLCSRQLIQIKKAFKKRASQQIFGPSCLDRALPTNHSKALAGTSFILMKDPPWNYNVKPLWFDDFSFQLTRKFCRQWIMNYSVDSYQTWISYTLLTFVGRRYIFNCVNVDQSEIWNQKKDMAMYFKATTCIIAHGLLNRWTDILFLPQPAWGWSF